MVQKWSAASSTSLKLLTMMRARFLFLEPKLKVLLPHVVRLKRNLGIVWHVVIWKCMKIPNDLSRRRGDLWQNSSRVGKWTNNSTCYFIKHRKSFRSSRSTKNIESILVYWWLSTIWLIMNIMQMHNMQNCIHFKKHWHFQKMMSIIGVEKKSQQKNCCPW